MKDAPPPSLMQQFENATTIAVDYAWGIPLVALLIGGGLVLTVMSRGIPLMRFWHAIAILRGKYDDPDDPGEISHLAALSTALAATIGMGNIGGVAIAISKGGPGAIFWMWVAAVVGMSTKFFSCTLACMYRKIDADGIAQGGPMYYIELGLGRAAKPLAVFFAVCGLVGCLGLFQANQLSAILLESSQVPNWVSAIGIVVCVSIVILGGLKRIALWSEKLVPAMCVLYVLASLVILLMNAPEIPHLLLSIVTKAFGWSAVEGGAIGSVIIIGVQRAAFSNEAGIGTAPMAHGAAKTDEPVREGLVAMLGPMIDTLIVCTMTALVILSSGVNLQNVDGGSKEGVILTAHAFGTVLGPSGRWIIATTTVLFAVSTMFGYAYYGRKCCAYLVGPQRSKWYNYFYIVALGLAAIWSADMVVNILDTAFAMMAIPNMIAVLLLSPRVMAAVKDYFARLDA
ncbi:alanine/glycine:cation symporter family protein [Aeoliella mucimassa]|uniref:Amino-acid carrier protein AlsT n=1 Tax=Aeoliella mucimassa TaxID=2527972 RepID=A0A518ARF8_9BACT|nr:alanine/glycine:cation symporter family protein [Aeoliella mucimassa]QDU57295.1 Amino-acid carrier protein AlsT [Aeoliella mucimassa]